MHPTPSFLIVLLALLLGACAIDPAVPEAPAVNAIDPQDVPEPESAALIVPDPEPEPEPVAPPPPPVPVPDPASLMGYSARDVEGLFGTPTFLRRDPPAELWQYQATACVLDLFLYEDGSGQYLVTHLEFRDTGQGSEKTEHCLRDIVLRRMQMDKG